MNYGFSQDREVLFRGIQKGTGVWVKGYYQFTTESGDIWFRHHHWISDCLGDIIEVEKDTVSQYIGQRDAGGTRIFEGDILKIGRKRGKVTYYPEYASFVLVYSDLNGCHLDYLDMGTTKQSKILGNIWENVELLSDTLDI